MRRAEGTKACGKALVPQNASQWANLEVDVICISTPRKYENTGPVLLGPVSHRARLCVEPIAEGRGPQLR